jgi:hypothetical protein
LTVLKALDDNLRQEPPSRSANLCLFFEQSLKSLKLKGLICQDLRRLAEEKCSLKTESCKIQKCRRIFF